jgi:hypothetical protein
VHPDEQRTLSVAECLRLQGFPDDWQLAGSVRDKFLQLGNAVPVPLAYAAAQSIKQTFSMELTEEMPAASFNPAALRGAIARPVITVPDRHCGAEHGRDLNAAKNIDLVGAGHTHNSKRTVNTCKTGLSGNVTAQSIHPYEAQLTLCF